MNAKIEILTIIPYQNPDMEDAEDILSGFEAEGKVTKIEPGSAAMGSEGLTAFVLAEHRQEIVDTLTENNQYQIVEGD